MARTYNSLPSGGEDRIVHVHHGGNLTMSGPSWNTRHANATGCPAERLDLR